MDRCATGRSRPRAPQCGAADHSARCQACIGQSILGRPGLELSSNGAWTHQPAAWSAGQRLTGIAGARSRRRQILKRHGKTVQAVLRGYGRAGRAEPGISVASAIAADDFVCRRGPHGSTATLPAVALISPPPAVSAECRQRFFYDRPDHCERASGVSPSARPVRVERLSFG